ncbi:MAG: MEDS domain-containing protein, partial [Candidatus Magasanikbacteria bacterium]|nr:MEDS domain-containing protein [Candidatus Magasanikbacteria bacterium]
MSLFFKKNKLARVLEKKEDKNQSDDSNRFIRAVEQTAVHDHLCVIYKTKQEEFAAAVPFIRVGLEHGEKCIYVVDENSKDEVLAGMRAGGITIDAALEKGDFSIITKNEAYLRHGYFDPDEMIAFLKENTDLAK